MHKHTFQVNREKCTPTRIHFKCEACGLDCTIWRNTYNLLVKRPIPYWGPYAEKFEVGARKSGWASDLIEDSYRIAAEAGFPLIEAGKKILEPKAYANIDPSIPYPEGVQNILDSLRSYAAITGKVLHESWVTDDGKLMLTWGDEVK